MWIYLNVPLIPQSYFLLKPGYWRFEALGHCFLSVLIICALVAWWLCGLLAVLP